MPEEELDGLRGQSLYFQGPLQPRRFHVCDPLVCLSPTLENNATAVLKSTWRLGMVDDNSINWPASLVNFVCFIYSVVAVLALPCPSLGLIKQLEGCETIE